MEYLLFTAYLLLFAWLTTKVRFFTNSGLTHAQLIIIFLLKVMAGIIYGWIGVYYGELAQMVDTWSYHYESLQEYQVLLSNPLEFFTSLFRNGHQDGYTRFLSENSWWNDLKANFFIKILAIFNLLSFGHYYINVVFYSFLSLFGPIAFYRIMQDVFPQRKLAVLLATFLVPSFLYWTSGLHKDGFIFLGLAMFSYLVYFSLKERRITAGTIILIIVSFLLVLGLRNFYVLPLIPAVVAWVISARSSFRPLWIFTIVYAFSTIFFFSSKYLHPKLNLPQAVVEKQQAFINLVGGVSSVHVSPLQPTVESFAKNLPQAISLSVLRPYPSDVHHLLSLAAATEVACILIIFMLYLVWGAGSARNKLFVIFGVFFATSMLLMIGYTVNNLGAIVRYRSVVLPFLIIPMVAMINWRRIFSLVRQTYNILS